MANDNNGKSVRNIIESEQSVGAVSEEIMPLGEAETSAVDRTEATILSLESKLQDSETRYLRLLADFDNYRKRTAAGQAEAAQEEKRKLAMDLLEVMDNLRRALAHARPASGTELQAGVTATLKMMEEILSKHGVERIDPIGRPFDPHFHEVLDVRYDPDCADMTVTQVYKDGYLFSGKLLRPALVQVTKQPEPEPQGQQR